MKKSLVSNAVLNLVKTAVTVFFPVLTFMYASRIFLTDGIGKINFAKSFIAYFTMLGMLGVVNYGTREASQIREDREALSRLSHELLIINFTAVFISYLLLGFVLQTIDALNPYYRLLVINSFSIALTALGMEWLYSAVEDYKYITLRTCVVQILALIVIVLFVHDSSDMFLYAFIQMGAATGANILNFLHAKKYIDFKRCANYQIKRHIKSVLLIFLMTLFIQVFTHLDTTMLTLLSGDHSTGLYTAANRMCGMTSQLITAIAMVFMPRIARCCKDSHFDEINVLAKYAVNIILMFGIPTVVGLQVLANEIISLFSGVAFLDGAVTAQILSLRALLVPLNSFFTLYFFIPLNKERWNIISTGCAAIVNFCLNLILIQYIAQNGAAIATVIAEIIELTINLVFASKLMSLRFMFRIAGQYICGSSVILFANRLVDLYGFGVLSKIFVTIGISVPLYFVILVVLKNSFLKTFYDYIEEIWEERK